MSMKNRNKYHENITRALSGEYGRYVQKSNRDCYAYPMNNAKYRRLLKLAEYQNQALQGRRKYLPPASGSEL